MNCEVGGTGHSNPADRHRFSRLSLLRINVIQHPIHRQLGKRNHLLNPQGQIAFRAFEEKRQFTGHDTGQGQGFASANPEGARYR